MNEAEQQREARLVGDNVRGAEEQRSEDQGKWLQKEALRGSERKGLPLLKEERWDFPPLPSRMIYNTV